MPCRGVLEELEALIGAKLPQDFYDIYSIHNGTDTADGSYNGLVLFDEEWLSIPQIIGEVKIWLDLLDDFVDESADPSPGVKQRWWNPKWVPITASGSGDSYCIDLDPDLDNNGTYGQIIRMWHDDSPRNIVATSLLSFIERYLQRLDNGHATYDIDMGGFYTNDDYISDYDKDDEDEDDEGEDEDVINEDE